ncbi:MAG TPA: acyltransferase [Solirubrobacteraceae bacterium]|nr:acyltransferase [Solirubrobacteraceae bacterium]
MSTLMAPNTVVPVITLSRRERLLARLRGELTLAQLRRNGLKAPGPILLASRVHIDPAFAWAITIGSNVRIAHDVRIIAHDAAIKHLTGYTEVRPVVIGDSCYIGAGAIVLPGTTIGDGAVIGAGAVVRGEITEGVIAAGNPARALGLASQLRQRHEEMQTSASCFEWRAGQQKASESTTAMQDAIARDGRIYVL